MGSRARARARAREETHGRQEREAPQERETQARDESRCDQIFDAGDFWGESASSVHHAMRAPSQPEQEGGPTSEARPPQMPRARHRRLPRSPRMPRVQIPHAPTWSGRTGGQRVGWRAAALAVAVTAVAVIAIIGVDEGSTRSPVAATQAHVLEPTASHRRSVPGAERPRTTTGRTLAATAIPQRSISERKSVRGVATGHRRLRRNTARQDTRASNAGAPTAHVSAVSAVATTMTAPESTTVPTTPVATKTTPSATVARDGATGSGAGGRSDSSSPQPSGPLGPGGATGCDPKCS
jgi:hypothetical protein